MSIIVDVREGYIDMIFSNGSEIKARDIHQSSRGRRSELIGFYCDWCGDVHEDYPFNKLHVVDDMMFCDFGWEKLLEELEKNI